MASLTRSLLALAVVALLQVACAQPGSDQSGESGELGKTCTVFNFGRRSYRPNMRYDLDPIHLNKQINEVKIHDPNRIPQRPGSTLIGEDITVCSEPGVHPHVIRSTPLSFDFFRITARHAKDPIDIVMYVTRYIEVNPVPLWQ